ncbi:MAG: carbohydrate kinase family protein [Bacilli bacterium]|jgi:sugar/nucleoside kinase (ribokinase family)|nr:carbohydrate kinase family protein [Bacilli bacterium]
MEKKVTVAGTIVVDNIKTIQSFPSLGMLSEITSLQKRPGGIIPNVLSVLRQLDSSLLLAAIGLVGKDSDGEFLSSWLQERNIDTSGLKRMDDVTTGFTDAMCVEKGERTFFTFDGADSYFDEKAIDIDKLDCSIFHIGYLMLLKSLDQKDSEKGTRMASLLSKIQARHIKTSIDLVSKDRKDYSSLAIPSLKYADYVIINEIEAGKIAELNPRDKDGKLNLDSIKEIMTKLMRYGIGELLIVHSPEASFSLSKGGIFTKQGSFLFPPGYIKTTVGAGDAFCAGALYGLLNGLKGEELLSLASSTAGLKLNMVNGIDINKEAKSLNNKYSRRQI